MFLRELPDSLVQLVSRSSVAPGLIVMAVVLFILGGLQGTMNGLTKVFHTFTTSFIGGGPEEIAEIVWRTLPLTIAIAIVTFCVSRKWLAWNATGIVFAALMVVVGGFLGNTLQTGSQVKTLANWLDEEKSSKLQPPRLPSSRIPTLSIPEVAHGLPIQHRVRIEGEKGRSGSSHPNWAIAKIPRLPKLNGVLGLVFRAFNQLIYYIEEYQPRLFLASLVVGVYLGWTWDRQIRSLKTWREKTLKPMNE